MKVKKPHKDLLFKIEVFSATMLVLVLLVFLVAPYTMAEYPAVPSVTGITGYISADMNVQSLNIVMEKSQSYILTTNSEESFYLTSFRLSGETSGNRVEIWLEVDGQRQLVFTNLREKREQSNLITGMLTGVPEETVPLEDASLILDETDETVEGFATPIPEDMEVVGGAFNNECTDTCFIGIPMSPNAPIKLIFKLDSSAKLTVDELTYTIEEIK